jgi:hypothetical protein
MPFGSARERRSRTTYRPTVTPEGSTHVDTFTGTTSSFSRTASGKVAVVAVVANRFCGGSGARCEGGHRSAGKIQRTHSRSLDKCREVAHLLSAFWSDSAERRAPTNGQ